jgi:PII-like signaling protein
LVEDVIGVHVVLRGLTVVPYHQSHVREGETQVLVQENPVVVDIVESMPVVIAKAVHLVFVSGLLYIEGQEAQVLFTNDNCVVFCYV